MNICEMQRALKHKASRDGGYWGFEVNTLHNYHSVIYMTNSLDITYLIVLGRLFWSFALFKIHLIKKQPHTFKMA